MDAIKAVSKMLSKIIIQYGFGIFHGGKNCRNLLSLTPRFHLHVKRRVELWNPIIIFIIDMECYHFSYYISHHNTRAHACPYEHMCIPSKR